MFCVGYHGNFDRMAASALRSVKQRHYKISLILVLAYSPAEQIIEPPQSFDGIYHPSLEATPRRYPKLKVIEKVAKEFSEDPEQILPSAGALESAKTYREKKAKPFWSKIVTVLRSLYRAYMDLKERYNALQQRFFRERMRTDDLCDRIAELTEQNKQLTAQNKQSTQALETLKQAFGKDQVEVALESANPDKISDTTPQSQYKWSKMGAR